VRVLVFSEELGEQVAGAEFAQVEHGGQDSVSGRRHVAFLTSPFGLVAVIAEMRRNSADGLPFAASGAS
jgi:hypothetical protein